MEFFTFPELLAYASEIGDSAWMSSFPENFLQAAVKLENPTELKEAFKLLSAIKKEELGFRISLT